MPGPRSAKAVALAGFTLALALTSCSSPEAEDPAAFCELLRTASVGSAGVGSVNLDDSESVEGAVGELAALAAEAPEAIVDDVELVSEVYAEALTALASTAPGARDDVLRELQPRLDSAAAPAANLERYADEVCRVQFEAPAEPTPTPTPVDVDD